MNRNKKVSIFAIWLMLLMVFLAACGSGANKGGTQATAIEGDLMNSGDPAGELSQKEMDEALGGDGGNYFSNFAAGLMKSSIKGEKGNLLISPISVFYALGMVANGSTGETREELLMTLTEGEFTGEAICGTSSTGEGDIYDEFQGEINRYLKAYAQAIAERREKEEERNEYIYEGEKEIPEPSTLNIANSIWIKDDDKLNVEEEFLKVNREYYGAGAFKREFNDITRKDMNTWIEEHTGGVIKDMLSDIPEEAVMYLVNALAFQAGWADPFYEYQVKSGVFHGESEDTDGIQFMTGSDNTYIENDKARGFIKYYQGYNYAFVGLLPKEGVELDDYINELKGDDLRSIIKTSTDKEVIYTMPKFREESKLELVKAFEDMGVKAPFDSGMADFSKLGTYADGNLYISNIIHDAYIDVNEDGTQAGAATIVEVAEETAIEEVELPKEVVLNKPFLYMLMDTREGLPLFIGVIRDL